MEDWYAKSFVARSTSWGKNTMQLQRSLLRNNIPGSTAIGPHYDQTFLRYGDTTDLTAWVPTGDVSMNGGGLIYLQDSTSRLFVSFAVAR